jgi:hypothetical protein
MYVPPYVPQQIEIPGNVAEEKYLARLGFVRRVVSLHFLTVLAVAGMTRAPLTPLPAWQAGLTVLAVLTILSVVRGVAKGRDAERLVSVALLPLLLFTLAVWLRALHEQGWAVWTLGIGAVCATLYSWLCGRDLSFVGMFVLALLASTGLIVGMGLWLGLSDLEMFAGAALNGLYLFYFVYDLAALQTRRRLGEEWGAVVDLYRDALNGIAYPIRVIHHWRKHNIWGTPKEWFRGS